MGLGARQRCGPQALSNVPPLRNYFLEEDNYKSIQRPPGDIMFLLVQRFGELMRKLWNPRNFKAHVSPHEMLQAVVLCSKKNFQITKQGEATGEAAASAAPAASSLFFLVLLVPVCRRWRRFPLVVPQRAALGPGRHQEEEEK